MQYTIHKAQYDTWGREYAARLGCEVYEYAAKVSYKGAEVYCYGDTRREVYAQMLEAAQYLLAGGK